MKRRLVLHGTSKVLGNGEAQLLVQGEAMYLWLDTSMVLTQEDVHIVINHWSMDFACPMMFVARKDNDKVWTYIWKRAMPFYMSTHTFVQTHVRIDYEPL